MNRNCQKEAFLGLGLPENENFHASEASDEQKLPKRSFPRPRIARKREFPRFRALGEAKPATDFCRNRRWEAKPATDFIKKRKKLRIPWTESSENAENCKFCGRFHQKSLKTANSVGGIIRNRRKLRILWTESSKNGKNRLSPPWGKSESPIFCVSPPWGKPELPIFCVSPP